MIPMNPKQEEDMNFNVKQGSVKETDDFNFPIPGHSLTDEPKKWMWDKPAQFTDPDMAADFQGRAHRALWNSKRLITKGANGK